MKMDAFKENALIKRVKIPLDRQLSRSIIHVKCGDSGSRKVYMTLTQNGAVYPLRNIRIAAVKAIKPDGKEVFNYCQILGDEVVYEITSQTVNKAGRIECELIVYGNDLEVVTSAEFSIEATKKLFDDNVIESQNEYTIIEEIIHMINTAYKKCERFADEVLLDRKRIKELLDTLDQELANRMHDYIEEVEELKNYIEEKVVIEEPDAEYEIPTMEDINNMTDEYIEKVNALKQSVGNYIKEVDSLKSNIEEKIVIEEPDAEYEIPTMGDINNMTDEIKLYVDNQIGGALDGSY